MYRLGDLNEYVHQDVFGLVAILHHAEGQVQYVLAVVLPEEGQGFAATELQLWDDCGFDQIRVHFALLMIVVFWRLQKK